ncbi:YbaB/EbfC family nucleoid-associated protein [Micromonospora sp. CPCC 206171]|uniref:YbaB/EbfC family nucleoid-associated protein n=1 Tax=Micromonospora sp. CPCC 206171 TaxID=3122405 RepID=UPI002FEF59FE
MNADAEAIAAAADEARRQGYTDPSLRAVRERVDGLAARIAALREESVEATDATGTVTARVTGDGEVAEVYLSPQAVRDLDADQLGAACLEAVRQAQTRLSTTLTDRIRKITGNDGVDQPPAPRQALDEFRRGTGAVG